MNRGFKVIDVFKILSLIILLTIILTIFSVKTIERTNEENKLAEEQISMIEKYISENQTAEQTKKLLEELYNYIEKETIEPDVVPTIEFYGKDNDNLIIMYIENDELQKEYYKSEVKNLISKINDDDNFYIAKELASDDGYVCKIVIEYNY